MPEITEQIIHARKGKKGAASEIIRALYDELRQTAVEALRRERPDHTLHPTALVHEVYLRLVDQTKLEHADRTYFLALAAREMRRVLIDHARAKGRLKRGRGWARVILDEAAIPVDHPEMELLDIDDALNELTEIDPQKGQIVELRFFSELTIEEVANQLGVSVDKVKQDWRLARIWLCRRLRGYE